MTNDDLGDRMKQYENCYNIQLTHRMPLIIRVDGKAFHSFTQGFDRPFDVGFQKLMQQTAQFLLEETQGAEFAYTQSDEISLLLIDYQTLTTQAWFDKKLQKIVSVSASLATKEFNRLSRNYTERWALFDSRAFVIPREEVVNYFIWRQQDATRNSIQMAARSVYSHKECVNKDTAQLQEMLFQKGINWNDYPISSKRGTAVYCGDAEIVIDLEVPIFSQDRNYIERLVYAEAES